MISVSNSNQNSPELNSFSFPCDPYRPESNKKGQWQVIDAESSKFELQMANEDILWLGKVWQSKAHGSGWPSKWKDFDSKKSSWMELLTNKSERYFLFQAW